MAGSEAFWRSWLAAASLCLIGAAPALAGGADAPDAQYCARLSSADHFSSQGQRLNSVGAVIRQDRANYYVFAVRDREDQSDRIFGDKVSREALQARIDASPISAAASRAIMNGTPRVCVTIIGDTATVAVVP